MRWAYNILYNSDLNEVIHKLPDYGADGWELIQITTANIPQRYGDPKMLYIAWFKRPID